MSKLTRGIFAALITCVAALPLSVSASASVSAGMEDAAVKVSYADLNISNEAGARALYRRLQQASREVCGVRSFVEHGSLEATAEARQCYNDALESAVAKIGSEMLSDIHSRS